MADGLEQEEKPASDATLDFDFGAAEELVSGNETKSPGESQAIEGNAETPDDVAAMQARSLVGVMDMSFSFMGAEKYEDDVYREGERHIAPAIVRLNFRLPALEFINAIIWVGFRIVKSIREIKLSKSKDDAEQKHQPEQQ